ncbi:MAG: hypothetical protein R6V62_02595 [Candidatus Fermentibacteraceae bacterium]
MKTPLALLLPLLMATAQVRALSVFPVLGYSSSTGFIIGGTAAEPILTPDSLQTGIYTLGILYGTTGMVSVRADCVRALALGSRQCSLSYERLMERDWFGWGNNTHPDTTAEMDYEKQSLSILFGRAVSRGLLLHAGVSVRHSSVYRRQESPLWDLTPSHEFGSTWTLGPDAGVTLNRGLPGAPRYSAGLAGALQTGSVTYGSITGRLSAWLPAPGGLEMGVVLRASRHYGADRTPTPYAPCIGYAQGFRGYSDFRFTGPVWLLCSAEARKMLISFDVPVFDRPWQAGLAVFADAGQVAESFPGLGMKRFHFDSGVGLRLLTHDNLMLNVDGAWGDEGLTVSAGIEHPF